MYINNNSNMSDIFTRTLVNEATSHVTHAREIHFVSRERPVKIVMKIKQTKDRVIINRFIHLGKSQKVIKKG